MTAGGEPLQLFFGLFPDAAAREALAGIARATRRDTGGRSPRAERIHLTLLYLGNAPRGRLDELVSLATGVRLPPFELCLDNLEYWKKNGIVCATPDDPVAVTRLAQTLVRHVTPGGFKSVRERFKPHVTLVRDAKRAPPENMAPVTWTAGRFRLLHSVVDWNLSRYDTLAEFPLRA